MTQHTADCQAQQAARLEAIRVWAAAWPHACACCRGAGGHRESMGTVPYGSTWVSLPDGFEPCPACEGRCPRCGITVPEAMFEDKTPCPSCGWNHGRGTDDVCPPPYEDCSCWMQDENHQEEPMPETLDQPCVNGGNDGDRKVAVHLLAFGQPGDQRIVTVPSASARCDVLTLLNTVFHFGQNDIQLAASSLDFRRRRDRVGRTLLPGLWHRLLLLSRSGRLDGLSRPGPDATDCDGTPTAAHGPHGVVNTIWLRGRPAPRVRQGEP